MLIFPSVSLGGKVKVKVRKSPGLDRPIGFEEVDAPRFQVCQPYAPAAFTPQEIFLVLISVRD
jgi:hypothetical protein